MKGECIRWQGAHDRDGYGRVGVNGINTPVHRATWIKAHGDPGTLHVLHYCENRDCYNLDHLHLGTHQENMAERDDWGHGIRGERVATARLTEAAVRDAIARRQAGESCISIAQDYGVNPVTISHAVTGRTWRHLERV